MTMTVRSLDSFADRGLVVTERRQICNRAQDVVRLLVWLTVTTPGGKEIMSPFTKMQIDCRLVSKW